MAAQIDIYVSSGGAFEALREAWARTPVPAGPDGLLVTGEVQVASPQMRRIREDDVGVVVDTVLGLRLDKTRIHSAVEFTAETFRRWALPLAGDIALVKDMDLYLVYRRSGRVVAHERAPSDAWAHVWSRLLAGIPHEVSDLTMR